MAQNINQKDFLILSYNEGAEDFTHGDHCNEIKEKIIKEKPLFIFVCTQESKTVGKEHYQHILGTVIKEITLNNKRCYKPLLKVDASISTLASIVKTNKNVRTRIYYNENVVLNNITTKSYNNILKSKSRKYLKNTTEILEELESYYDDSIFNKSEPLNDNHEYIIRKIGIYQSKKSGLGELTTGTIFKGAIYTRLEIADKSDNLIKFVIINTHLYFHASNTGNTGLSKRKKQFDMLINEFKLPEHYNNDYNIFFCGDLNFRLFDLLDVEKFPKSNNALINRTNILSEKIITMFGDEGNNVIDVRNNNNTKITFNNNELYKNIKTSLTNLIKKYKNSVLSNAEVLKYNLFKKFYKNAKKFGIHLTCKIHQNTTNETKKCFSKKTQNGMFNCSHKGAPRIPSMCDKILTANQDNILITKDDFTLLTKLRKSDHHMISLTGKFFIKAM